MHLKKVAQLLSRSMHFANELAKLYISYNDGVCTWYTLLIGWVLHGSPNFWLAGSTENRLINWTCSILKIAWKIGQKQNWPIFQKS